MLALSNMFDLIFVCVSMWRAAVSGAAACCVAFDVSELAGCRWR